MISGKRRLVEKNLRLTFHGKILDHLSFQTYQSRTASLAEIVANAWDADATRVSISYSDDGPPPEIVVEDNGSGMTFDECEGRYLNVGYDRRKGDPKAKTRLGRPVMGRKGIGKFAGFGIARTISVETTSKETGETTKFDMNADLLRSAEYVGAGADIRATTQKAAASKDSHGTKITLRGMRHTRKIREDFPESLARRFLVHRTADDFEIAINGERIPDTENMKDVEFEFPKDYESIPDGTAVEDGWGIETVDGGRKVQWRIYFSKEPVSNPDLRGISVFANGKLVQNPFFFNLTGGVGGQHGQEYMFGQVVADFVDQLPVDATSTERQRIHWGLEETVPLLEWGQDKVKEMLRAWIDKRGQKKAAVLDDRISGFRDRLDRFSQTERATVTNVLKKIGGVTSLGPEKYREIAELVLKSWEGGRLKGLWEKFASNEDPSEADLLEILSEADILSALSVAEAIKTKLYAIEGLQERVRKRELETRVRDHLAQNPWIIGPEWETFAIERSVTGLIKEKARESKMADYGGRTDLVLSGGPQLLVLELTRPGLALDWDHAQRCARYVQMIKTGLKTTKFSKISGYIISDRIDEDPALLEYISSNQDLDAVTWEGLLDGAKSKWRDYLEILATKSGDPRLARLLD